MTPMGLFAFIYSVRTSMRCYELFVHSFGGIPHGMAWQKVTRPRARTHIRVHGKARAKAWWLRIHKVNLQLHIKRPLFQSSITGSHFANSNPSHRSMRIVNIAIDIGIGTNDWRFLANAKSTPNFFCIDFMIVFVFSPPFVHFPRLLSMRWIAVEEECRDCIATKLSMGQLVLDYFRFSMLSAFPFHCYLLRTIAVLFITSASISLR